MQRVESLLLIRLEAIHTESSGTTLQIISLSYVIFLKRTSVGFFSIALFSLGQTFLFDIFISLSHTEP